MSRLTCTKCGAELDVGDTSFSVICTGCNLWHLIDRSGDVPVATAYGDSSGEDSATTAGLPSSAGATAAARGDFAATHQPAPPEAMVFPDYGGPPPDDSPLLTGKAAEIAEMDLEWEQERRKYYTFDLQGNMRQPDLMTGLIVAGIALVVGGMGLMLGNRVVGGLIVLAGVGFCLFRMNQYQTYFQAMERFQRRRRISAMPAKDESER